MLASTDKAHLRDIILERLGESATDRPQDAAETDGAAALTLDQQRVGRLSRMDAIQQQAMSTALHGRQDQERARLRIALQRLEDDPDFGFCKDCGDKIALGRLKIDPAACLCISCARG